MTAELVQATITAEVERLTGEGLDAGRLVAAAEVVRQVAIVDKLPDFLTLIAGTRLD